MIWESKGLSDEEIGEPISDEEVEELGYTPTPLGWMVRNPGKPAEAEPRDTPKVRRLTRPGEEPREVRDVEVRRL